MSDRRDRDRDRKRRFSKSRSRSRSRSSHKKKSYKDKHQKKKNYKRHSSSRSRSSSSSSGSSSPTRGVNIKLEKKTELPIIERHQALAEFTTTQEESSCLIVTGIPDNMTQSQLEELLTQVATNLQTSPPESIQYVSVLKTAYAVFPTVECAKRILFTLRGKLDNGNVNLTLDFYPAILAKQRAQGPSKDVTLVQDWICDKCEYKNFAKRTKCHKCDNIRNSNCKVVYNSASYVKQNPSSQPQSYYYTVPSDQGGISSIMVRGSALMDVTESQLLDLFNKYAPVKDIRLVKNRNTGNMKDFAFVEFFTPEEAERVVKMTQGPDFRVNGQPVTISLSRTKRREDELGYSIDDISSMSTYQRNQYYGMLSTYNPYYSEGYTQENSDQQSQATQQAYNQYQYQQMYQQGQAGTMNQYTQLLGQQGLNYGSYQNYNPQFQQSYNIQLQQQLQPSLIQQTVQQKQQIQAKPPVQTQPTLPSMQGNTNQQMIAQLPLAMQQLMAKANTANANNTTNMNPGISINDSKPLVQQQTKAPTMQIQFAVGSSITEEKPEPAKADSQESKSSSEVDNKLVPEENKKPAFEIIFNEKKTTEADKVKEELERKKQVEMEMKKWEREQQMKAAAESQQTAPQTQENKIQIQLEPEKFAPLQVQNKKISIVFGSSQENTTTSFDIKTEEPKTQSKFKVYLGNIPVCRLCQRKFKDDYSIEMHEKFSKLHKENLQRLKPNV